MVERFDCKHCQASGKCHCDFCNEKADVKHGFFSSWEVPCAICGGKGYHVEASQLGPRRMPKPYGLRMPGLTPMPKFPGLTNMPKLPKNF